MRSAGWYTGWICVASGLLYGCAAPSRLGAKRARSSGTLSVSGMGEKAEEDSFFISAETARMSGNNREAILDLDSCLRLDPGNAAAYYELARLFDQLENPHAALAFASRAVELDTLNRWYQLAFADALMQNKQYDRAESVFYRLHQRYPSNMDYLFNEGVLLEGLNRLDSAYQVFEEIEKKTGVSEQLVYQKQMIDLKLGKVEEAADEVRKLISQDPYESRYYGLLAQLYTNAGTPLKAIPVFREWLERMPYNPQALIGMALVYKGEGDQEKYQSYMAKAFANPDLKVEDQIAFVYPFLKYVKVDSTKKDEGLMLCRMIIKAHPASAAAYALYGDMFNQCDLPDSALTAYRNALSLDGATPEVWQQVMLIYSSQQRNDSVLEVSRRAILSFPDDFLGYYFHGAASVYLHLDSEGIVSLRRALDIGTDNRDLEEKIYALLGEAYHDRGDNVSSDSSFERSLRINPGDALVLNNYSYYLALRGIRLDQAEQMARMAVTLEPGDYSYEDTYAWVLYKLGRFRDAKKWMEKALEHPEAEMGPGYLEHYGNILYRLHRVNEAVRYWQLALQRGGPSQKLDQEISGKKILE